jgi:hypothetical protein
MLECRTVRHSVSLVPDGKQLIMPEQVWYWTKLTQSGMFLVQYHTKIRDAGMPMPALVSSMPMPSYACGILCMATFHLSSHEWSICFQIIYRINIICHHIYLNKYY